MPFTPCHLPSPSPSPPSPPCHPPHLAALPPLSPSFSLFFPRQNSKVYFWQHHMSNKDSLPYCLPFTLSLSSCSSPRCLCASAMGHVRVPHRPLLLRVLRVHRPVHQPQPSIPEPIDFIDFRHRCGRLLDPRQVTPGPPHPSHTHTHPIPSLLCLPYLLPASSHRPTLSCLPNEK